MAEAKEFFSAAKHALEEVKNTQREAVYEAAKMMGDCMLENGLVHNLVSTVSCQVIAQMECAET